MQNLEKLKKSWKEGKYLCVGLDTDPAKIPDFLAGSASDIPAAMLDFNKRIIDSTRDLVCAYKLNSAFYEKYRQGMKVMKDTVDYIKETAPEAFVIADAKRGDIGNTNLGYEYFINDGKPDSLLGFDSVSAGEWSMGFDAMTMHGYLGREANGPFLSHNDKFFFILGKTSNPGSGEFQDLETEGLPLYLRVAKNVKKDWNANGNCGLVVGAPYPEHLMRARNMAGEGVVFLVPGVGAQGGNLKDVIQCGMNSQNEGVIVNMSRSVIYASAGEDFAEAARDQAMKFNKEAKDFLKLPKRLWPEERAETYKKRTMEIFEKTGALIAGGHFVYQTKTHGDTYMTKDRLLQDPIVINEVGMMLADMIKEKDIETVAVPAVGGIVLGHVVAKYLSYFKGKTVNSVFIEKSGKDAGGRDTFKITRGYDKFLSGKKVAVVEDTVNTGYSVKRVIDCVKDAGGKVETLAVIFNRGSAGEDLEKETKMISLVKMNLKKYDPNDCPLCKAGVPINTDFGHGK